MTLEIFEPLNKGEVIDLNTLTAQCHDIAVKSLGASRSDNSPEAIATLTGHLVSAVIASRAVSPKPIVPSGQ